MRANYGPFFRYDESPIWQIHRDYFNTIGLKAWSSGEIPYSGISNFAEAFKKARLVIENLKNARANDSGSIDFLEIGAGYGEFAKNFLAAFESICKEEDLDFFDRVKYIISDFSQKTLNELDESGRLKDYCHQIEFVVFDALNKFDWQESSGKIKAAGFDAVLANYLLDQLPARIFAKDSKGYYEKYLALQDFEDFKKKSPNPLMQFFRRNFVKKLSKKHEFREIDISKEVSLEHQNVLEACFREDKASTLVYSYSALAAIKNFLYLLKDSGLVICSDFNAATKPGFDKFEPCYYGNSIAQAVNFEFIYKYFAAAASIEDIKNLEHRIEQASFGHQMALVYEDPVKPLHTLIISNPKFKYSLELGKIYQDVYHKNWLLRTLYKFMVEVQLSFYVLLVFMLAFVFYSLF